MASPSLPFQAATYSLNEDNEITLCGARCTCGYLFFPLQHYGCERCGADGDSLQEYALLPKGQLVSSTTVHVYGGHQREAPFVVGAIRLQEGPVIRALIKHAANKGALEPGQAMTATVVSRSAPEALGQNSTFNNDHELNFVAL
ncbi:hypothetical protein NBRC116493_28950 [Aurantivibrio infirmus]